MNKARAYLSAYRNKISNKLSGVVRVPAQGVRKGDALLSYLTSPFTLAPGEFHTDPHASYWECTEIARLLSERGYDVDIINWNDDSFAPKKRYSVVIDIQRNLERLVPMLPSSCVKIMHVVSSYAEFQNAAEAQRLAGVKERRGAALSP
ncbi:MAG TPA: hypothetical protein VFT82_00970, partial [Candidatus Paceibacterota bacterium]|nr:hypothetical protein [Candidatus Paceibacterota bacterium]